MNKPNFTRAGIGRYLVAALAGLLTAGLMFPSISTHAQDAPRSTFDDNAKAVFRQHCSACHGPNKKSGNLDLSNYSSLMMGGSSGTVIEPGDSAGSYLISLITHEEEPVMPPGGKISDAEIEIIRKWIDDGAPENAGSKVNIHKPAAMSVSADPLARPEFVANWPRIPLEPVQRTLRNPVVKSIATSPWAPIAAVAGQNQVLLYDTSNLQLRGVLPFPEGTVNVVRFSRNGSILLAAGGQTGASGVAVLWDVASGERIGVFGDELDAVIAADISPDHSRIALGGQQRVVNVYSLDTGEREYQLTKNTEWVTALEFSVDGVLLASGDRNGGLYVFEAFTGREYLTLKGHEQRINDISWRSDSNVVASACDDVTIRLWEMNNGSQIRAWNGHAGGTKSVEFLRDGRLVSTGDDRVTRLWQPDGTQVLEFSALEEIGLAASWCNETGRALAGDYLGNLRVWNGADGALLGNLTPNPPRIQEQIDEAIAQLSQIQSQLDPLNQELVSVTEAANQATAKLDAATQEMTVATQSLSEMQTAMEVASQKQAEARAQMEAMQTTLTSQSTARNLVGESLVKLQQALEGLPNDQSLAEQIAGLANRVAGFDTDIGQLQSQIAIVQQVADESGSQVTAATEMLAAQQVAAASATSKVEQATTELQPLVARRDELTGQVAAARASLEAAQNELNRWTGELAFVQQLETLNQRISEAREVAAQQQSKLDDANRTLAEIQAATAAVQAEFDKANQTVEQIKAEIDAARQINQ